MKTVIAISIDGDIAEEYKETVGKGNVSRELEEYMKRIIATKTQSKEYNDIELIKKDIEIKKKSYDTLSAELRVLNEQKDHIEQQELKKDLEQLQKEAEEKANAKKCVKCNNVVDENRKYTVKNGFICRSCFMNLTGDQAKQLGL